MSPADSPVNSDTHSCRRPCWQRSPNASRLRSWSTAASTCRRRESRRAAGTSARAPDRTHGGRLMIPVVLASQSPARRQILTAAGIDPQIIVSEVDERAIEARFTGSVGDLTTALSEAKARAVIDRIRSCPPPELTGAETVVVIAGDSLLEHAGQAIGKPGTAERTRAVWSEIAGQWTQLHTGHTVAVLTDADDRDASTETSA